jgi:hypothetical protein
VHVNRFDLMRPDAKAVIRTNPTFAQMEHLARSPEAFLDHMDREGIQQAWLVNYCAKEVMGYGWEVNPWVSNYCMSDRRRLVAVGGYDPRHDGAGERAIRALADLGIRALKVHCVHQSLSPDDDGLREALGACERLGMPVIFHTGTSRFPGAQNSFADPSPAAAVCAAYPRLRVVLAHGGRPDHTLQARAVVAQHANAWIDVSSCPPHRLKDYFGDLEALAPRLVWGSDWPGPGVPGMAANVEAFLRLGLSERANRMVLRDNAMRLLGG